MPNMSYCRFENTYKDLIDCIDHLEDKDLSESERFHKNALIEECKEIANMNEDNDEEEDEDA